MKAALFLSAVSGLCLTQCAWGIDDDDPDNNVDPDAPDAAAVEFPEGSLIEEFSPPEGGIRWTCPDGTVIALTDEVNKRSTICLGIDGFECPVAGSKPGPGETECNDPEFNAFSGTCLEAFFSCFQPSGTCTVADNGNQEWTNGALQDRNADGFQGNYLPDANGAPCITSTLGDGTVIYLPSE